MPQMKTSMQQRVVVSLAAYFALVVIAAVSFGAMRQGVEASELVHASYSLCGPSLSLFTHMSYFLFALQSLLLLPWIGLYVLVPKYWHVAVFGFGVTWLGIGWYMRDLF